MNKEEFLLELRKRLSGLPEEELGERLAFYSEMIEERVGQGMTEEEAIAGIGMVDSAADQILSEIPLSRLVMEKRKKSRKRSPWVILLLILGSPIWLSLLIAAAAVLLSLYIVAWALVISFFAVDLALAAAALAALPGAVLYLRSGNPAGAAFAVGAGMVCAALAIFLTFGSFLLAKGVLFVTRKILFRIKISVAGKGE